MTKKAKPQTKQASATVHTLRPVLSVVNSCEVPRKTLALLDEVTLATIHGEVAGIALVVMRRHGLPPVISITDAAIDHPEISLGLASRLTYLLNRRYNENYNAKE